MELLLIAVFAVLAFTALTVYFSFSYGFVLFKFWYWFLLPVFTTLPHIGFYSAVGLVLFISIINSNSKGVSVIRDEYIDNKKKNENIMTLILTPWIVLLTGWIIKLIIG